ncbi:FtsX-like permease family protein [Nocardiopsis halotolerans]|uniref:FtsX-like permease family protein n=1 Tax=Nocardiopsis halotolerans TaxID=124252 RepID=UPI000349B919|nr:FtsX-like permease family protein [Nocardiopsis halotolerans]
MSLTLAWRMLRQDGRRSVLGAGLLGLPVAVAVLVQILYSTAIPTPEEDRVAAMGAAQARVLSQTEEASARALRQVLPERTRILRAAGSVVSLQTSHGPVPTSVTLVDLSDPLTEGLLEVTAGRVPERGGQVLVSQHLGSTRGMGGGDQVGVGEDHTVTITGLVLDPTDHDRDFLVGSPTDPALDTPREGAGPWLVGGLPPSMDEPALVELLGPHGFTVDPRTPGPTPGAAPAAEDTTRDDDRAVLLFTALGLGEVGLLAAAVFTLTAQRRRRELGLLSAAGARPTQLRRVVLAHGVLVAATGALAGLAVGVVLALAAQPLGEQLVGASWGPPVIRPDQLVWIVALALVAGLVAAWLPAWSVARRGPVAALRDAPPPAVRERRTWAWPLLAAVGLVVMVVGIAVGMIPLAGAGALAYALGLLGSCALMLRALAALAAQLGVRARVALRGPARSPSRSLPLAVAVCAVTAAASVAGVLLHSADQHNARTYVPRLLDGQAMLDGPLPAEDAALRPVTQALGGARVIRLSHAAMPTGDGPLRLTLDNPARRCARPPRDSAPGQCPKELGAGIAPIQDVAVADEDLVAARFAQPDQRERALRALRGGRVVLTDPALRHGPGQARLVAGVDLSGEAVEMDAEVIVTGQPVQRLPHALISPKTLAEHDLLSTPVRGALLVTGTEPTPDQVQAARASANRHLGGQVDLYVERGYDSREIASVLWLFMALAAATAVGTAAIAGALSSAEHARDDAVMAAVGARPRFLRAMAAARLLALTVPAGLLGLVGGGVAMLAALWAWGEWPPAVPWIPLTAMLVATAAAAWLTGHRPTRRSPGTA